MNSDGSTETQKVTKSNGKVCMYMHCPHVLVTSQMNALSKLFIFI